MIHIYIYIHIGFHRLNGSLSKDMGIYFFQQRMGMLATIFGCPFECGRPVRKPTVGSFKTTTLGSGESFLLVVSTASFVSVFSGQGHLVL